MTSIVLFQVHRRNLRRLEADRPAPNQAAKNFRARVRDTQVDMGQAFAEFIAGRLECPVAAVIRPKLSSRLTHAGLR